MTENNNIQAMGKEELIDLVPDFDMELSKEDILHIWRVFGGFWSYDYEAAKKGNVGLHALLKSLRHSDGFLFSKIVLVHPNIRLLMAMQLVKKWGGNGFPRPDYIAGIPVGATELGEKVAYLMHVPVLEMAKTDGRIEFVSELPPGKSLLLAEDFCTRGTGFSEAVRDILSKQPEANILSYELVIVNRGGLKEIEVEIPGKEPKTRSFKIVAAAEHRIKDWDPEKTCPVCNLGSGVIRPKDPDHPENWDILINSQK